MFPIRVLVVDDSLLIRTILTDILNADSEIQVVGTAKNGLQAIEILQQQQIDVVTLDIEMPVMTGLQALPQITRLAIPVIMLSSHTLEGADLTMLALEQGAFDFVTKPTVGASLQVFQIGEELRAKVKMAAQILKKPKVSEEQPYVPALKEVTTEELSIPKVPPSLPMNRIVGIGTSTGGPRALQQVLSGFPVNYPASVVIVQHMPIGFTASLAKRLNQQCAIHIKEAVNGELLRAGTAYIAPGDFHLTIVEDEETPSTWKIHLDKTSQVLGHRPSVDVLFHSLAQLRGVPITAVIMTGMGRDGADGMKLLKSVGATTIAESEETCVVFGMPRAAIQNECIDYILPVDAISKRLLES